MSTQEQRNAEIWSTRIQRELLALTTDNADKESTEEVRAMLPSFVTVKEHALDIADGSCKVLFQVEVVVPKKDWEIEQQQEQERDEKQEESSSNNINSDATGNTTAAEETGSGSVVVVVVSLDASLPKKEDGSIDASMPAYPFGAPVASLTSGEEYFPPGSTIFNGNRIGMDMDWTPSLHLTDAILNVGLKIKESISQKEAFHPLTVVLDPVDEMANSARRFAHSLTKASSSITKASSNLSKAIKEKSQQGRDRRRSKGGQRQTRRQKKEKPVATPGEVRIGDEINLLAEPWVDAHGVYSCKAIRRPVFVQEALAQAAEAKEQQTFSSPTAMFRSFAQSARGVLEESFLMITETHIIEMKSSKLNMSTGTVTLAIPIELMAKLKFRRQESVSLFFKVAPDDPLIYMCPDSGDAVHQIQAVLKRHGVKGKHTNAAAHRAINEALHLVQEIQTKELALKHDPTVERVNEIMDLYRQAAERFEVAGDIRHEEVVTHMRKFLALPLTTSILEGTYKKPDNPIVPSTSKDGEVPQGEVLERTEAQIQDEDLDFAGHSKKEKLEENDKAFEENMDNLLKEAQQDLEQFMVSDGSDGGAGCKDPTNVDGMDSTLKTETSDDSDALADVAADLDAMMKEADKELAELMSS